MSDRIIVKTRYGKETHWGGTRSSVTNCGVWLRANGSHYAVRGATMPTCEKCIAQRYAPLSGAAPAIEASAPAWRRRAAEANAPRS